MIFTFFNILSVLAATTTPAANASSSSVVAAPGTTTNRAVVTSTAVVSSSAVVSRKATTSTLLSKEICVQCYDKEIKTPDCKECNCECKCDNKKTTFKKSNTKDACPSVDLSKVPCECKENGKLAVDKSYKPKPEIDVGLSVGN